MPAASATVSNGGMGGVALRPGGIEDHAFVLQTWLRTYHRRSEWTKPIDPAIFYEWHTPLVLGILRRASLLVATPEGQPGTILGWLVAEGPTLHFVYVKGPFRRFGVARALVGSSAYREFTHWTYDGDHLVKKHPDWKYNPYRR